MRIEDSASKRIMYLCDSYGLDKNEVYEKAQLVISVYHEIVWGSVKKQYDGMAGALEKDYRAALAYLQGFPATESKSGLQAKLLGLFQPGWLSALIGGALRGISDYARNGNEYAEILNKRFFSEHSVLDKELYPMLRLTKSTYFRMRKEAISFLGVRLWGNVLPEEIKRLSISSAPKKAALLLVAEDKEALGQSFQKVDGNIVWPLS